jgi:Xaa-Pro dipeptidase
MSIFATRRTRAAKLLKKAGLGAATFVPGPNFAYLTGVHLHLMERPTLFVLTAEGGLVAMMPALERQKWGDALPDAETIYWTDEDGPEAAFTALADTLGPSLPLGVEGLRMRASEYRALARHLGADALVDADPALAELRLVKDAEEIAQLRRAVEISEQALGEVFDAGVGGRTGHDIAGRLKAAMLAHGAIGFAFEPIVLSGGEAANPHGDVSDRVVSPGDPLLIDFGASWGDMHADITRTAFCGHASDAHAAVYETVREANARGRDAVRAGAPVGAVDDAATGALEASPFSDLILHKTGHGLGREVHEVPPVMRKNGDPQRAGMVFTIEPGLYRAGDIGVRIEDDVVVTDTGCDCLTSFTRELVILD